MNLTMYGDCLDRLPEIESGSIDLVIGDPPYFKVINKKWDYQWRTEEDYIKWSIGWTTHIHRILRYGGTFYLFGYFKMLVKLIPYLKEMGFELRQQILIDKGMRAVAGRATKKYKMFPRTTESILFFIKDNKPQIKKFLKEQQNKLSLTSKEINNAMGVKSNGGGMWSIYTGDNVCAQIPTLEIWKKLQDILEFNLSYNSITQTFNPQMGLTDIWTDINFYEEKRVHPTQKPKKLIQRLILTSTNKGDTIIDPFAGSGVTYFTAKELDRKCIAIEKDQNYYNNIIKKI